LLPNVVQDLFALIIVAPGLVVVDAFETNVDCFVDLTRTERRHLRVEVVR
jgi:hypothetical protein